MYVFFPNPESQPPSGPAAVWKVAAWDPAHYRGEEAVSHFGVELGLGLGFRVQGLSVALWDMSHIA